MTQKSLFARAAVALFLGALLVILCYYFVDRPVAWFVHRHRLFPTEFWSWPPWISGRVKACAVPAIVAVVLWWVWKPGGRLQTVLLAVSANLIVTALLKNWLKGAFGRYWPETWKHNNPSLIANGVYGFHPFHGGEAYESFPSGHAAVMFAVLSILWFGYPRWRWCYTIVGAGVCAALVGMNYHFVGDVIAGGLLGSITGVYVARLFRLDRPVAGG